MSHKPKWGAGTCHTSQSGELARVTQAKVGSWHVSCSPRISGRANALSRTQAVAIDFANTACTQADRWCRSRYNAWLPAYPIFITNAPGTGCACIQPPVRLSRTCMRADYHHHLVTFVSTKSVDEAIGGAAAGPQVRAPARRTGWSLDSRLSDTRSRCAHRSPRCCLRPAAAAACALAQLADTRSFESTRKSRWSGCWPRRSLPRGAATWPLRASPRNPAAPSPKCTWCRRRENQEAPHLLQEHVMCRLFGHHPWSCYLPPKRGT